MGKLILMNAEVHITILVSLFLSIFSTGYGQIEIEVSKQTCVDKAGFFIDVRVRNDGILLDSTSRYNYDYGNIYQLPDSIKIKIIEEILPLITDTSKCCRRVNMYSNPDYSGCFIKWPSSKEFSINVEALFIINRIAYWPFTYRIGCYPVLFDTRTHQEINSNNCLINIMALHYNEWFAEYKKTGKRPHYSMLNEGRIKWW